MPHSVFTLTSSVAYPVGMTVRAYPREAFPTSIVQGVTPPVAPVSVALMQEDGRAVFADLNHGRMYVAGARVDGAWAYVQFRTADEASATGVAGASAYEMWLGLGNTGSESDFLASLRGPKGDPGQSVTGPPGTSVKGDKGDKGDAGSSIKGDKGDPGKDAPVAPFRFGARTSFTGVVTLGAVAARVEVLDSSGAVVGYSPVYKTIVGV